MAGQVGVRSTLCKRRRRREAPVNTELRIVGNVLTRALLLAGIAGSYPGHCHDLAASEGCGQRCCLQGFEGLLRTFVFFSETFNRKKGHFILCLLVFLALWTSLCSGFLQPAQETKTIQRSLNGGLAVPR